MDKQELHVSFITTKADPHRLVIRNHSPIGPNNLEPKAQSLTSPFALDSFAALFVGLLARRTRSGKVATTLLSVNASAAIFTWFWIWGDGNKGQDEKDEDELHY